MGNMKRFWIVSIVTPWLLVGCDPGGGSGGEGSSSKCIEGTTQACSCSDGAAGAQTCTPAGLYAGCVCDRRGNNQLPPADDDDPPSAGNCSMNTDCGLDEICIAGECREMWDRTYEITVVEAEMHERDHNGESWDTFSGAPDMYVSIRIDGESVGVTSTERDTYSPRWNESVDARLFRSTEVVFRFIEEDPVDSDPILNLTLSDLKGSIKGGGGSWENSARRGVANFVYFIEPR